MPKKITDQLIRDLTRDISSSYAVGDHYLTLAEVGAKFGVSYKVAQKAMKELASRGMVRTIQNSESTVLSLEPVVDLTNRRIAIVSAVASEEYTSGFRRGIQDECGPRGIQVELIIDPPTDRDTTRFGDYLLGLRYDGIICLGFASGALGFCHAINRGLDIVSDTPLSEIPYLPSAHTDNFEHGRRAGERLRMRGASDVMIVTGVDLAGDTHRGFMKLRYQGLLAGLQGGTTKVIVVPLFEPGASGRIDDFLSRFSADRAIFSISTESNFVVTSKCYQHGVAVTDENLLIYNSADDMVSFYGLPKIRTIAPSRARVGAALARKLITKWETGKFAEPMWEPV